MRERTRYVIVATSLLIVAIASLGAWLFSEADQEGVQHVAASLNVHSSVDHNLLFYVLPMVGTACLVGFVVTVILLIRSKAR